MSTVRSATCVTTGWTTAPPKSAAAIALPREEPCAAWSIAAASTVIETNGTRASTSYHCTGKAPTGRYGRCSENRPPSAVAANARSAVSRSLATTAVGSPKRIPERRIRMPPSCSISAYVATSKSASESGSAASATTHARAGGGPLAAAFVVAGSSTAPTSRASVSSATCSSAHMAAARAQSASAPCVVLSAPLQKRESDIARTAASSPRCSTHAPSAKRRRSASTAATVCAASSGSNIGSARASCGERCSTRPAQSS